MTATTQKNPKIAFRSTEPSCSSILRNSSPTKKFITCFCVILQRLLYCYPFPKKKVLKEKKPYPVNSKTNGQCCCPKTTRAYLRQEKTWNRTSSSCKRQDKPAFSLSHPDFIKTPFLPLFHYHSCYRKLTAAFPQPKETRFQRVMKAKYVLLLGDPAILPVKDDTHLYLHT